MISSSKIRDCFWAALFFLPRVYHSWIFVSMNLIKDASKDLGLPQCTLSFNCDLCSKSPFNNLDLTSEYLSESIDERLNEEQWGAGVHSHQFWLDFSLYGFWRWRRMKVSLEWFESLCQGRAYSFTLPPDVGCWQGYRIITQPFWRLFLSLQGDLTTLHPEKYQWNS